MYQILQSFVSVILISINFLSSIMNINFGLSLMFMYCVILRVYIYIYMYMCVCTNELIINRSLYNKLCVRGDKI